VRHGDGHDDDRGAQQAAQRGHAPAHQLVHYRSG
jgi:hypothetical protein